MRQTSLASDYARSFSQRALRSGHEYIGVCKRGHLSRRISAARHQSFQVPGKIHGHASHSRERTASQRHAVLPYSTKQQQSTCRRHVDDILHVDLAPAGPVHGHHVYEPGRVQPAVPFGPRKPVPGLRLAAPHHCHQRLRLAAARRAFGSIHALGMILTPVVAARNLTFRAEHSRAAHKGPVPWHGRHAAQRHANVFRDRVCAILR